jgi:predicted nucleic acid-binding protein
VPQLFFYEVMAVAAYAKFDLAKAAALLDAYQKAHLRLVEPNLETLKTAAAMTGSGHPKSGYPSFYDTLYHALALSLNCPFITVDKKHYEKTRHLGAINLVERLGKHLSGRPLKPRKRPSVAKTHFKLENCMPTQENAVTGKITPFLGLYAQTLGIILKYVYQ